MWLRSLIVVFIALMTLPYLVVEQWYIIENKSIKREVKQRIIEGIEAHELVTFSFSKQEVATLLDWKHAHEFIYKGQFYDIVSQTESTDSITYQCWWDKAETELNQRLNRFTAASWTQTDNHSSKGMALGMLLKRSAISTDWMIDLSFQPTNRTKKFGYGILFNLQENDPSVPLPPPECYA
jgi:hypothetical protein